MLEIITSDALKPLRHGFFTRKGGGAVTPSLSMGGGSYGSANASANLSGGGDKAWWNLGMGYESTNGFNACDGVPGVAGCFTDDAVWEGNIMGLETVGPEPGRDAVVIDHHSRSTRKA